MPQVRSNRSGECITDAVCIDVACVPVVPHVCDNLEMR